MTPATDARIRQAGRLAFGLEVSAIDRDARLSDLTRDEIESIVDGIWAACRLADTEAASQPREGGGPYEHWAKCHDLAVRAGDMTALRLADAIAALTQRPPEQAGAVPAGWKLVPIDLTYKPAMREAAWKHIDNKLFHGLETQLEAMWSAMLAAAPTPPDAGPGEIPAGMDREAIDMLLHCPRCGVQHVDAPTKEWSNPPHRSHLCLACGYIWRPADVPTNGVSRISTKGSADSLPLQPAGGDVAAAYRAGYEQACEDNGDRADPDDLDEEVALYVSALTPKAPSQTPPDAGKNQIATSIIKLPPDAGIGSDGAGWMLIADADRSVPLLVGCWVAEDDGPPRWSSWTVFPDEPLGNDGTWGDEPTYCQPMPAPPLATQPGDGGRS